LSKRHPDFDYEEAGLLADVHGDDGRDARIRLLDYLIDEELVDPDEVVQAHEEQRLFLLPVERALGGTPMFTAAAVISENDDGRRACPNRMRRVLIPLARAMVTKSFWSVPTISARSSRV
jgi:hypothetical protein